MSEIYLKIMKDHNTFLKSLTDISEKAFSLKKCETPEEKLEALKTVLSISLILNQYTVELERHWEYSIRELFTLSNSGRFQEIVGETKRHMVVLRDVAQQLHQRLEEYRQMRRPIEELTLNVQEAVVRLRATLLEHIALEERLIETHLAAGRICEGKA